MRRPILSALIPALTCWPMRARAGSKRAGRKRASSWSPETPTDLIYANAAFQWSNDPIALVRRLFALLPAGGVLAFQVPQNFDQSSHVEVRAAVDDSPWAERARAAKQYDPGFAKGPDYVRAADASGRGAPYLDRRPSTCTLLDGPEPGFPIHVRHRLAPVCASAGRRRARRFQDAARARLARAYPPEADGRTLFPFRRLFVIAQKPG